MGVGAKRADADLPKHKQERALEKENRDKNIVAFNHWGLMRMFI